MVEVVVPFGVLKADFLSGCPVELGVVAASKEGEDQGELFDEQFSLGYTSIQVQFDPLSSLLSSARSVRLCVPESPVLFF